MRSIVIAESFDLEFFNISSYIEQSFGPRIADEFENRFDRVAQNLASSPRIGTTSHGFPTDLYGFVMAPCWIFYRFDDDEIVFVHIRDGRMNKADQKFLA